MNELTKKAFEFLCKRNPFDIEQINWVCLLMKFEDSKGGDALQALAGAYVWAIDNLKGKEVTRFIKSTFAHDLNGSDDKWMEPRSSSYKEFWEKELINN